jgi:hypothetical protein
MQLENGDAMTAELTLKFLETYGDDIHRRVETLRQGREKAPNDPVFLNVPISKPRTPVKICVETAFDNLPWESILGSTKFEGFCKSFHCLVLFVCGAFTDRRLLATSSSKNPQMK